MRMRDIHGNQRNLGAMNFVCNRRRNSLINLKLNNEIDALADKFFGVPHRYSRVVLVIQDHQVDASRGGSGSEALPDGLGKRHSQGSSPESKAHLPRPRDQPVKTVLGLREIATV